MSKKSKMRWRESDVAQLERVIKNFNAKLTRITKRGEDMTVMPDRLTKKGAMESIETRADFNRFIKSAQRFSNRGAEEVLTSKRGAKATRWAVDEFKRAQRAVNQRRAHAKKKLEEQQVRSRGKEQGVTRAQMGTIKENAVRPSRKKFENASQREWEMFVRSMEKQLSDKLSEEHKELIRENYIKAMIREGMSEELQQLVKAMPIDEFIETLDTDSEATFDFVYGKEALEIREEALTEVWESALERCGIDPDDVYNGSFEDMGEE